MKRGYGEQSTRTWELSKRTEGNIAEKRREEHSPPTPPLRPVVPRVGVDTTGFRGVHPLFEKKLNQFVKRKKLSPLAGLRTPLLAPALSVYSGCRGGSWEPKRFQAPRNPMHIK